MKSTKAEKKMAGSVAEYLTHKGVPHTVDQGLTFGELDALQDACDPLALESVQAHTAAHERLAVLKASMPKPKRDALTEKAQSLINPLAIARYAAKAGKRYRDWVAHKVAHPRGKSPLELAEAYMKLGEIDVALKGYTGEQAEQVRLDALHKAKLCLLATR